MIAGIFSSPILSRMGLFLWVDSWVRFGYLSGPFLNGTRVKRIGLTTLLWIKCVFGVCGELWLVLVVPGLHFGLSVGIFGSWKMVESKNEWKNVDKTW